MKTCPFCAEEIQDAAIVCKHCGRDLVINKIEPVLPIKKHSPKKGKRVLIAIVSFLLICLTCLVVALISDPPSQETTQTPNNTQIGAVSTVPVTQTPEIDKSIAAIMEGMSLPEAEASRVFEVIKSIGFERVEKVTFIKEYEGLKAYSASLGYTKDFLVTITGNEVFGVTNGSIVFYDRDAGGVLDKVTNYILNTEEKGTFIYLVQENVKSSLKSPSTAKFPGVVFEMEQWKVSREKDIVWVQSWVDAENSFGALIRSQFTAQYSYSTKDLLYLQIDEDVVFGQIVEP